MMQIVLPSGPGWAALPLVDDVWGRVGVVAKCGFGASGARQASSIGMADVMAGDRIAAEADTALFKSHADFHMRGLGVAAVDGAEFLLNGAVVLAYLKTSDPAGPDNANLFGYEPRDRRISLNATGSDFVLTNQGAGLFRSARRGNGFALQDMAALPFGSLHVVARSRVKGVNGNPDVTTTHHDLTLTLPRLTLHVWIHEGGPDREPYWCAHTSAAMAADTLTLTPAGAEVLWRGSVPSSDAPLGLIRKLQITEDA